MRVPTGPVQALVGAGAVGIIVVTTLWIGLLTSGDLMRIAAAESSETPSAAANPWWADKDHPRRTAEITATISPADGVVTVTVKYDLVLQPSDPLVEIVRRGETTAQELSGHLLGDGADSSGAPALEWRANAVAHVQFTATHMSEMHTYERLGTAAWITFSDSIAGRDPSKVAVRTLRVVTAKGLKIVAVRGDNVEAQSAAAVAVDGPPAQISIAVVAEEQLRGAGSSTENAAAHPFAGLAIDSISRQLFLGIVLLAPWWTLLALSWHWRTRDGASRSVWLVACVVTVVGPVAVALELPTPGPMPWFEGPLLMMGPLVIAVAVRLARGQNWWSPGMPGRLLIAAVVTAATAWWAQYDEIGISAWLNWWHLTGPAIALGIGVAVGLIAVLLGRPRFVAGATVGLLAASLAFAYFVLADKDLNDDPQRYVIVAIAVGLAGAAIAEAGFVAPRDSRYSAVRQTALFVAGALLFLPAYGHPTFPLYWVSGGLITAVTLLDLALVGVVVGLLNRHGRDPSVLADSRAWALGLACLLVVGPERGNLLQFNALSTILLVLCWWMALPWRRRAAAARMASISATTHFRLFRAELRRRLMEKGAHDTYRQARAKLRDGSLDIRAYDATQRRMDEAATPLGKQVGGIPVRRALSTSGGQSPREAAIAAVVCASPVILTIIGYDIWARVTSDSDDLLSATTFLELAFMLLNQLRWVAYAAVYGFFYTLIRGHNPVTKAFTLATVIVPAELLSVLSSITPEADDPSVNSMTTTREVALALAIQTGQAMVFAVALGLAWEGRLVTLAGYRWDRLRNIRSIRSLATPAGTVAVAIATALGTAVASTAVAALLATSPVPVPAQPPPTTSPAASR